MKIRGMMAVLVLGAATMFAQAAPASDDAAKPADHAACMHDKDAKMGCCKKHGDAKTMGEKDCCKKGQCARMKKDAEKKS
jgi:Spy/CpxP family protein refolding chaperone